MITVIVDTTATFVDVTMKSTNWMQLLTLSHNSTVELIVPDVVLRETARHWEAETAKAITITNGKIGGLKASRDNLADLGINVSSIIDSAPVTEVPNQAAFLGSMQEKLLPLGVVIMAVPAKVDIETILDRDLSRSKPFDPSGKGFRDALVWETVKDVVFKSNPGDKVFFVTGNSKDFCNQTGEIAPELLDEVDSADGDLERVASLEELLAHPDVATQVTGIAKTDEDLASLLAQVVAADPHVAEPPPIGDVVKKAVQSAVEGLSGEPVEIDGVESWGTDFSALNIPGGLDELSIDIVEIDESTLTWQTYESYQDTTFLIQAEVVAQVSVEGYASKGDAVHLEAEGQVFVLDWNWNDHVARVATSAPAKLTFQVQLEHGMSHAESCELESVSALTDLELHMWTSKHDST